VALFAVTIPAVLGQAGAQADPVSGTWSGDWGPNAQDRNQVSVELKWDGKAVTGVVRTANRPEVALSNSTYDAATRTVRMQALATNPRTKANVTYTIEGKVDGNSMTGSWNHDAVKGDFKLTRK
jgi:hypothetical protein